MPHGVFPPDDSSQQPQDGPTLPLRSEASTPPSVSIAGEQPGSYIGPYKLLEVIGEGGFGTVWMAERRQPMVQRVALKIIKAGMDTRTVVARFEQERQALAMMDHPNIAKVLDAGATEAGRPYFVMELCKGEAITSYCDRHALSLDDRLELFATVCLAVQHAHQKGLIHRDIKPSNVLVSTQDGKPFAKVIDFGIAKATASQLTEKTLYTAHRQFIGTPEYMSPEQAEGSLDVDTRTDVYSLGVLLYELLTGTTPFDSESLRSAAYAEMQRIIREEDPPLPSARLSSLGKSASLLAQRRRLGLEDLRSTLHRELEWIPLKAMRKDRSQRYSTASQMAEDVRNYLNGVPLIAGPESTAYKLRKLVRRRKGLVAAVAAVVLALVAGVVGTGIGMVRAQESAEAERVARNKADAARMRAQATTEFLHGMLASIDPEKARGHEVTVREIVDNAAAKVGKAFPGDPVAEADMRETLGETYHQLSRFKEAKEQLQQAYELRARKLGPDDPETLTSQFNIAAAMLSLGEVKDGKKILKQVLEARARTLGELAEDTLLTRSLLGFATQLEGDAEGALQVYRQTLELQRRLKGASPKPMLETMASIADVLQDLGRLEDAEAAAAELVKEATAAQGAEGPTTLTAKSIRASILKDLSRYADAEALAREVLLARRRIYGPDHIETLTTENVLALVLEQEKKYDEAAQLLQHASDAAAVSIGPENSTTLSYLGNLARQQQLRGHLEEAERIMRRVLDVRRRTSGETAEPTLVIMNNLGLLLLDCKKPQEAEPIFRAMLAGIKATMPPDHWMQGQAMINVAECLVDQEKFAEAEALERAGYDQLARVLPAGHARVAGAANALASLYQRWGKPDQEAAWRAKAGK